jgi:hypothetical protein
MFYVKTQVIPRNNTLFISVIKTDQFMLCMAKVVFVLRYIQNTQTQCWQNVQFLDVKPVTSGNQ